MQFAKDRLRPTAPFTPVGFNFYSLNLHSVIHSLFMLNICMLNAISECNGLSFSKANLKAKKSE